jgi:hypothetical protein
MHLPQWFTASSLRTMGRDTVSNDSEFFANGTEFLNLAGISSRARSAFCIHDQIEHGRGRHHAGPPLPGRLESQDAQLSARR